MATKAGNEDNPGGADGEAVIVPPILSFPTPPTLFATTGGLFATGEFLAGDEPSLALVPLLAYGLVLFILVCGVAVGWVLLS